MKRIRASTFRHALVGSATMILAGAPAALAINPSADVWARTVMHADGSRTVAKKDTNSRIVEAMTYDKSDTLIMKRIFQMDSKGNSRRGFIFDGDNNLVYRLGFVYDEIDRLKETVLYDLKGEVVTRQAHAYDVQGREMKPKTHHVGGATPVAGQIRPEAAIAAPGSDEPVLQATNETVQTSETTTEPAKKKRFFFFKRK